MTKTIVLVVWAVVVAAAMAAPLPVPSPVAPPPVQQMKLALQRVQPSSWKKLEYATGAAAAVARPTSKRVWISTMKVPGQNNFAKAGFKLPPVSVGGSIPGARVKATFSIEAIEGYVGYEVMVVTEEGALINVASNSGSSTLTNYQLTSPTFTIEPNKHYVVSADVWTDVERAPGAVAWAVATISDISWDF